MGKAGQRTDLVTEENKVPTAEEIGLTRKQIHEARQIRDAEKAEPGITEKILNDRIAHGEEPTRAAVKKEIGKKRAVEKKQLAAPGEREPFRDWAVLLLLRVVSTGHGGTVNRKSFSRFLFLANETADEHLCPVRPAALGSD